MWFSRRQPRPQLDLAALDRLSDTIARAVALIEERLALSRAPEQPRPLGDLVIRREPSWPEREPLPRDRERRREPEPRAMPPPKPAPEPAVVEPLARAPLKPVTRPEPPASFILVVPTPAGYRLATPRGVVPEPGERLRVEDEWYRVVRVGPSPLPGDGRRCAFLEPHPATLD
jgi:hypothetical protein